MAKRKPNIQIRQEIGNRLRNARRLAGLSAGEACFLTDIPKNRIEVIECGMADMSLTEAMEFAEHYNTTVAYLAGEEEYGEPIRGFMGQTPFRPHS